ncbi:hypothetical protein PBS_64070 [Paraburkholderia sp. 2C]
MAFTIMHDAFIDKVRHTSGACLRSVDDEDSASRTIRCGNRIAFLSGMRDLQCALRLRPAYPCDVVLIIGVDCMAREDVVPLLPTRKRVSPPRRSRQKLHDA